MTDAVAAMAAAPMEAAAVEGATGDAAAMDAAEAAAVKAAPEATAAKADEASVKAAAMEAARTRGGFGRERREGEERARRKGNDRAPDTLLRTMASGRDYDTDCCRSLPETRAYSRDARHGWHAGVVRAARRVKQAHGRSGRILITSSGLDVQADRQQSSEHAAKLMLVLLSLVWGLTWPSMRIALEEIPPFSMRTVSLGLGVLVLLLVVKLQGRALCFARRKDWAHIAVAGILNIVGFTMLSSFALLLAATSRVAMLAYTMPIWAALFAWAVLGERFTRPRIIALLLCGAGVTILIYPLYQQGIPPGLLLAVATGVSWAAGTVYLKWARIEGDPVTIAAWQLIVALCFVVACVPLVEGGLHVTQASPLALFGMVFTGLAGSGLAYFLWFKIVGSLPAMTASLGILSAPVIGVISTAIFLGERPTVPDMIGFVLIFAASACVVLPARS